MNCFKVGQRVWVYFTTVFAHRGAMYSCIGCALNKSVMSKRYVYIIGIVNWYIYHYLCLEDTKKYPVQTKLLYYDNFITDGSKAHG